MRFDPLSSRLDFDNLRQVDDKKCHKKFIKTPFKMAGNLIPLVVFPKFRFKFSFIILIISKIHDGFNLNNLVFACLIEGIL